MKKATDGLAYRVTKGGAWVLCPVCRRGKVLKLTERTRAQGLVLYCRNCKHESVVEIVPGDGGAKNLPRVRLEAGASSEAVETG